MIIHDRVLKRTERATVKLKKVLSHLIDHLFVCYTCYHRS